MDCSKSLDSDIRRPAPNRAGVLRTAIAIALVLLFTESSRAAITINLPQGLAPGAEFRIVFTTPGTTTATSTDISTYNSFVTAQAASEGGATFNGTPLTWSAIASTTATSAITNIGENTTQDIPIYLVDGTLVTKSDNADGLWSGSVTHSLNENLLGAQCRLGLRGMGWHYVGGIAKHRI